MSSNPDSDWLSDSDGDESSAFSWSELDWEKYLGEHEEEIGRFLRLYKAAAGEPNRLESVAHKMGWLIDENDLPMVIINPRSASDEDEDDEEDDDFDTFFDPYTPHRNPVYISTEGLCLSLQSAWMQLLSEKNIIAPDALLAARVTASLHNARELALQGIQCSDMTEYTLGIYHFKKALAEINQLLALLNPDFGSEKTDHVLGRFRLFALSRLFDLRDIWIRMLAACRNS